MQLSAAFNKDHRRLPGYIFRVKIAAEISLRITETIFIIISDFRKVNKTFTFVFSTIRHHQKFYFISAHMNYLFYIGLQTSYLGTLFCNPLKCCDRASTELMYSVEVAFIQLANQDNTSC